MLTLSLPSHNQIPVHLWTLKTRRLSRIPIRHEPAKGQRHNQNPSTLSTIHLESHLPHAKTLTTVVSPYPVNKLTVYYTHLCVWQFRYNIIQNYIFYDGEIRYFCMQVIFALFSRLFLISELKCCSCV